MVPIYGANRPIKNSNCGEWADEEDEDQIGVSVEPNHGDADDASLLEEEKPQKEPHRLGKDIPGLLPRQVLRPSMQA